MDTGLQELEDQIVGRIALLQSDIDAIQQPRSDFAIEHFVVGQHDTPGRQRMQAVLELQIKMFNIRRAQIEGKKLNIEYRKQQKIKESNGDDLDRELAEAEMERIEVELAEMELARKGAIREAQILLSILDRLPVYTYEAYQAEEASYWERRLSRQALQDLKAIGTVSQGNLDAISQMLKRYSADGLTLPETPTLTLEQLSALTSLVLQQQPQVTP